MYESGFVINTHYFLVMGAKDMTSLCLQIYSKKSQDLTINNIQTVLLELLGAI